MNRRTARRLGALLQGAVLGTLLFYAAVHITTLAAAARIFRYQSF